MQGGATGSSARPTALKTLATKVLLSTSLLKLRTLKRLTRALTFARLAFIFFYLRTSHRFVKGGAQRHAPRDSTHCSQRLAALTRAMPRYALKVEYDGLPFQGWQRQAAGQPTVQGAIEAALSKLEIGPHTIAAAGRTDAGVHAWGQVAHCDMEKDWADDRLMAALNAHLRPLPVSISAVQSVDADFHARFSAIERRYVFRLIARRAPITHDKGQVWQVHHKLDGAAMSQGAKHLLGTHDFTTFRAAMCQAASPVKTLDEITLSELPYAEGVEYRFFLRGRSFLHNQVRSIVGTLERVGAGARHPDDVALALAAKDRKECGPVCPPQGLYLAGVGYKIPLFDPKP